MFYQFYKEGGENIYLTRFPILFAHRQYKMADLYDRSQDAFIWNRIAVTTLAQKFSKQSCLNFVYGFYVWQGR